MGRFISALISAVVLISIFVTSAAARTGSAPLNSGWEFRQRVEGPTAAPAEWRPAEVPGCVHTDLLHNKLIPDPFYRENEAALQWIENASWEYRKSFDATREMMRHGNIDLVFEGIDAYAEVFLNGQPILTANNMFREWRVP